MTGPETIWEVIEGLGAERIGHGISCVRDPRLMAYLRETQIPLEVCPTSNVCTGQVGGLAEHPLPRMLEEGLFVTLNSDDPPMFDTTLTGEYRAAAEAFGLGRAELAALARNAVTAASLDETRKRTILDEIDALPLN
jgi:aminodeoxyfutalosine deaminase